MVKKSKTVLNLVTFVILVAIPCIQGKLNCDISGLCKVTFHSFIIVFLSVFQIWICLGSKTWCYKIIEQVQLLVRMQEYGIMFLDCLSCQRKGLCLLWGMRWHWRKGWLRLFWNWLWISTFKARFVTYQSPWLVIGNVILF